jgi:hypothetical protein
VASGCPAQRGPRLHHPRRQRHRHPALIRQAAANHGLALPDHASLGTTDQIVDTLGNLGLLLRQVEERTFPDSLEADPRAAYDHWLEYGFADQLRNAPRATADSVYDSYQSAYRELQTSGTSQHVTIFTRCTFSR